MGPVAAARTLRVRLADPERLPTPTVKSALAASRHPPENEPTNGHWVRAKPSQKSPSQMASWMTRMAGPNGASTESFPS